MREKLPEKWCVKADNTKIVQKFFLTMPNASSDYVKHKVYNGRYFHSALELSRHWARIYSCPVIREGYEELTMEEFKRLVLHIQDNDPIPEFLN